MNGLLGLWSLRAWNFFGRVFQYFPLVIMLQPKYIYSHPYTCTPNSQLLAYWQMWIVELAQFRMNHVKSLCSYV